MQSLKSFIKRNAPVFFLGLIITLVFLVIILAQPKVGNNVPAGFKKVEEKVFENGKPKEPGESAVKPSEYASQTASPENIGKPYFYGEANPNLRDSEGYPTPPLPESVEIPNNLSTDEKIDLKSVAQESYNKRTSVVQIKFTNAGFEPKDTSAYTGQKIEWINNTSKQIVIKQTSPIHQALKNGLLIEPGKSAIFRPLVNGLFSYLEEGSGKYGTIYINDITTPLQ